MPVEASLSRVRDGPMCGGAGEFLTWSRRGVMTSFLDGAMKPLRADRWIGDGTRFHEPDPQVRGGRWVQPRDAFVVDREHL